MNLEGKIASVVFWLWVITNSSVKYLSEKPTGTLKFNRLVVNHRQRKPASSFIMAAPGPQFK